MRNRAVAYAVNNKICVFFWMSPELSASSILDGVNDQSVNENHRAWRLTTDVYIIKIQNRRVKNTHNRPGIRKNLDNSQKKTMYGVDYTLPQLDIMNCLFGTNDNIFRWIFFKIKNVFKKWFYFQWCKLEIQHIEVHGAISEEYILLWSLIVVVVFSRQVMRVILCGKKSARHLINKSIDKNN